MNLNEQLSRIKSMMGILNEETESDKNCKIWVESEQDPKYIEYLERYKLWEYTRNTILSKYLLPSNLLDNEKNFPVDYDVYPTKELLSTNGVKYIDSLRNEANASNINLILKYMNWVSKQKYKPKECVLEKYGEYFFPLYWKPKKVCFKTKPKITNPTPTTTQTTSKISEPEPQPLRPNPVTSFSVSWREDTPSGDVLQNTHYFSDYNEWKEFVNQHPNAVSQNENGSKTEAQALYSGLHADISKDKTIKGPR